MKARPPLPTVPAREVAAIGAASVATGGVTPLPRSNGAAPVAIPLLVRPALDGSAHLVRADNGALVSPCATVAIAERTRDFIR